MGSTPRMDSKVFGEWSKHTIGGYESRAWDGEYRGPIWLPRTSQKLPIDYGFRGETKTTEEMKDRVEYDIWYLENWSLLLDIKLIFLTCWNMIKGQKEAF